MIRCFKVKSPVLINTSLIDIHLRNFHLVSQSFARNVSPRNQCSQAVEKNIEIDPHPIAPENSNVNFFGIESDEGVITVSSKVSCLQEKTSTNQLREKFYKTSYGVVRYDTDNKLRFHGQYGKRNDFVFPHDSNDISEVAQNITQRTLKTFDKLHSDHDKSSSINTAKSELNYEKTSSEVRKENSSNNSSEVSYIDQFYFETISEQKKKSSTNNHSTDNLNFIDKEYFGHCTESENQELSRRLSENISFKDEPDLKINSDIKAEEVEKPSLYSSTGDFNFIDNDYFGGNNISENQKMYSMGDISQDLSTKVSEENKADIFSHNLGEDQSSFTKSNVTKDAFGSVFQSNINVSESFARKQIGEKNLNLNTKLFNNTLESNNEPNIDSVVENDLLSKREHHQFNRKNETTSKGLSKNSLAAERDSPKSTNPSLSKKITNNFAYSKDSTNGDTVTTAYDFVTNLHKQQEIPAQNVKKDGNKLIEMKVDSKGFRILKDQVQDLSYFTREEILSLLKQSILYQDDNLLVLNKPYSLVMHESQTTKIPCLSSFLEDLAKEIDVRNFNSKLVTVHRLDKETTGCLLIARNEIMAQNLQSLFAQKKIIKKYWVLTSKVPDPPEGLINIPISEGSVNNKKRMVLHPEIPEDLAYKNHSRKGKPALTSYKVLSESGNAALVEATPITGIKHQLRVHLGFGLSCPIIGDHKYSHFDKLAPQKLPSDILQKLHVRQSKVRYVPLHIHAKSVTIPGYFEDRDLYIQAPLPNHMRENMKRLKFKKK